MCVFVYLFFWMEKILANSLSLSVKELRGCVCVHVCVFLRDLRVHSFRGVLELMWMLSIQMCPLVPCTKKPSITT